MESMDGIVKLEIISCSSIGTLTHADFKLFFCLAGEIQVSCGEVQRLLGVEDILLVNTREKHSWMVKKHSFGAVFYLSSVYIGKITCCPTLRFLCDSSGVPQEKDGQLRELLRKILAVHSFQRWQERIKEEQYHRTLAALLLKNFAVWGSEDVLCEAEADRMHLIVEFVQKNYMYQIRLQDLAQQLHLSVPYLSKYIKQNLKMGFVEYLQSVRLSHAVDDLNMTDHSMTRIAFDNGFSSVTAFNHAFRQAFSITPSEYSKKIYQKDHTSLKTKVTDDNGLVQKYLKEHSVTEQQKPETNQVQCVVNASQARRYVQNWKQLWNLGSAHEMLRADVQEHIMLLRQEFAMEQVRIWDLFSEEMFICPKSREFNFSKLDPVFDFLSNHQMVPFVDLGFHPRELYDGAQILVYQERNRGYDDLEWYTALITEFIRHYRQRYGVEVMERWGFEISKDDRLFLHGGKEFFRLFEEVFRCIKSRVPGAKVGAGSIFLYDELEIFEEFVTGWMKREVKPDFISVWLYPYDLITDGARHKELKVSGDPDYIWKKLRLAEQILEKNNLSHIPVYVTEWDLTLSCRNFLNESCYRGTFLLKNIAASLDKAEVMACYGSTDLLYEFYDSADAVNGGRGLLTKNAVKKPAYYAYAFLERMGKYLLGKGEHYLVTADGFGNYEILLFYCSRMDMRYYYRQNDKITVQEIDQFFDREMISVSICVKEISNGEYLVRKNYLCPSGGDILSEWKKLEYKKRLESDEAAYLRSICIPRLKYETVQIKNHILNLQVQLSSNEMQLLQIINQTE